jgi:glycerate 2-kinase
MRVLVVPDSFTGTLTSAQAAAAICEGWQAAAPHDRLSALAISDGGPGFVDALLASSNFEPAGVSVTDLVGNQIEIKVAVSKSEPLTFYIESAQIVGSAIVSGESIRHPDKYTSFGIGEAILAAIKKGARRVVIGLGGTAVIDGGAGMLAALGGQPATKLKSGASKLSELNNIDLSVALENLANTELIIAADVDVPLLGQRGAAIGFGAQKGASVKLQTELEIALTHFSSLFPPRIDGKDASLMLGAGAAGGIGFAALAVNATKVAGFEFVADALSLKEEIAASDLVITGEGSFDWQSMQGKAISQLAQMCLSAGKPLLVLAGQVDVGRREWSAIGVVGAYACSADGELPAQPDLALTELAFRVGRTFSPTSWQN